MLAISEEAISGTPSGDGKNLVVCTYALKHLTWGLWHRERANPWDTLRCGLARNLYPLPNWVLVFSSASAYFYKGLTLLSLQADRFEPLNDWYSRQYYRLVSRCNDGNPGSDTFQGSYNELQSFVKNNSLSRRYAYWNLDAVVSHNSSKLWLPHSLKPAVPTPESAPAIWLVTASAMI